MLSVHILPSQIYAAKQLLIIDKFVKVFLTIFSNHSFTQVLPFQNLMPYHTRV